MFGNLLKLLGLSRWYHHEQHADKSNARKASGQSAFSYDDLKGLRKLAFWLFVFSIVFNWGFVGAVSLIAWLAMWVISLLF
ncbi:hypothetical protein [Pediococcus pentosaceus]|jgi:hypothetical protein|uniref:Uncharacterized protein n=1 Tax=Pediococcus pentosaceus (strain ATCC 25745 / CCUG 21536 / LMG 10740 / 183-1w) TaxID=278197 RepID=Q03FI4_PEDPA|nr:hypothetical protein [Pediococcus pentosaceus]ABJ68038.1 hypothetical protein PEPE_0982 [Pediococcus pentosaceus ATCC 25745]AHA05098.1 hypothetical protein T256_04795 [Pediococcus pentosaceus SL4]KAF0524294.1 hypothetical protein GBP32_01710 [Pediococcus pentosaceus]MCH3988885.1 hypothetical protein [Pediococcus pentosaceus]MCS8570658.1 hypothetical protein [Pediococcus pentosaceus]